MSTLHGRFLKKVVKMDATDKDMKDYEQRVADHMRANPHHIWCNEFMGPSEGCELCADLNSKYPQDDLTEEELIAKHFLRTVI